MVWVSLLQELLDQDYEAKKAKLIERREQVAEQKRLLEVGGDGAEVGPLYLACIHSLCRNT
jgi:hypothetical protein